MEPFGILGVAASIITCVQPPGALLQRVGPSDQSKKDLNRILKAICGFSGAYEGLRTSLQLNEEDEASLILDLLEKKLDSPKFFGEHIVGSLWDAELKRGLKILQDAKTLFKIALDADQHTVLSAVERYIRNVAEDVRDLATHVNENGKRLLNLDERTREQSERVNAWHGETETAIHDIGENILAHGNVAKKQHKNTADDLHRIGHDVTNHRHEWRSEAIKRERGN
ncbi:hypothetical protein MMC22_004744 [Lobaria immixta]|nr:hypothetical protein [Lobaria immixta]